jgi:1-acyl-sn-glycerol-3-phosphate acyltransferase
MKKKKNKKWLRFRHRVVRSLLWPPFWLYAVLRYHIKIECFRKQEKRPYLILLNHQTPFDQFFVGLAFRCPVYYLATEDIFSMGWVSSLIRYLVAPIPIKKQTTDVKAILTCLKVAKEGGTIAIAPEGNRTYSGRTEYMSPSIAPLARKLGLPIALYRIEGGYGAEPRWSDVIRRGKMRGYVSRVISPEEYATLTDDELFALIRDGLYVNEAQADMEFHHKKRAEYLERAAYVCPDCGFSPFESHGDTVTCTTCGKQIRYLPTKELQGVGFDLPFRFFADWYDYQQRYVNKCDVTALTDAPIFRDTANVSRVIPYERKVPLYTEVPVSLYGDRMTVGEGENMLTFPFDEITATAVLGRNKLNVYHDGNIYQLKGSKRFNALKYVHIYHRYQNIRKDAPSEQFLGL